MIATIPKAHEIPGDLHGTPRRRQQFQQQRQPSGGHARRLAQAEHFLQAHRQRWNLAVQIVYRYVRAAGHGEMRRRLPLDDGALRIAQTGSQSIAQVHPRKMLAAGETGNPGRRPVLERRGERRIAQIRPRFGRRDGILPHQIHARLPLPQLHGPRQSADAQLPQARERGSLHRLAIGITHFGRVQQQRTQTAFAPCADRLFAVVPDYFRMIEDLRGKMLFQIRELQGRGEENPRLAFGSVQFRCDDEFCFGQRLHFTKACASAIRQQVSAAVAARPADPVGISPRQQNPGPFMRIRRVGAAVRKVALPMRGAARRLVLGASIHRDSRRQIAHIAA